VRPGRERWKSGDALPATISICAGKRQSRHYRVSGHPMESAQGLAGRLRMDAQQHDGLCQRLFKKPLAELTGGEASGLIGTLQEMREEGLEQDSAYRPDDE
jgi:hypothetical protein